VPSPADTDIATPPIEEDPEMRIRITATLTAMLLAFGLLAAPVAAHDGHHDSWGPMGPHAHALLLHATTVPNPDYPQAGPPVFAIAWERCVDLAGGEALPKSVHHQGIHTGKAGAALRERAGHIVVPYDCETYASFFAG
jgi:hypothetical protein